MGFISWLTGHDEKESDVYADFEKVDIVVEGIKGISSNEVASAKDAVHEAIDSLNNVNGLATYVGTVEASAFDGVFEEIANSITQIGEQIQSKANDIKTYEESAWYEKLGSTFAMAGAKVGEGLLSVGEDIGDGAVSLVGWLAPKDSGLEKACSNFVKKEWAHDAFNFYYKSDFAKKSLITEDSAAAGAFKIAGNTAGYLALGGALSGIGKGSGLASAATGSIRGNGIKAGFKKGAAKAANVLMGTSTRANTTIAALSGMGSGTESGLQQGLDFDQAALSGAKQGAVQGAFAYGMGKVGEKAMKNQAIRQQEKIVEQADDVLKAQQDVVNARKAYQDAIANGADDATKATLKTQYSAAKESLKAVNNGSTVVNTKTLQAARDTAEQEAENIAARSLKSFDGYHDSISNSFRNKGEKFATDVIANKAGKTGVISTTKAVVKTGITDAKAGLKSTFGNASGKVSAGSILKGTAKTAGNALKAPVTVGKAVVSAGVDNLSAASGVIGKVAIGGAEIAGAKIAIDHNNASAGNASYQFRNAINKAAGEVDPFKGYDTDGDSTSTPSSTGNDGDTGNSPSNTGGNPSGNTGGNPGGNTGGNPGGGTYPNPDGNSKEQFKQEDNPSKKPDKPKDDGDKTKPDTQKEDQKNPTTTPETPSEKPSTPTTPETPTEKPSETPNVPTQPGNPNTPTAPSAPGNNNGNGGNSQHTGGSFNGNDGYTPDAGTEDPNDIIETPGDSPLDEGMKEDPEVAEEIKAGLKYTKIPKANKPLSTTTSSGGGSTIIPIAAGLSAAAAAGIGAKVYMDRKKNNENGEYDEIDTEEWSEEDTLDLSYDDSSDTSDVLSDDDAYSYQAEETEKYGARNNEELADIQ